MIKKAASWTDRPHVSTLVGIAGIGLFFKNCGAMFPIFKNLIWKMTVNDTKLVVAYLLSDTIAITGSNLVFMQLYNLKRKRDLVISEIDKRLVCATESRKKSLLDARRAITRTSDTTRNSFILATVLGPALYGVLKSENTSFPMLLATVGEVWYPLQELTKLDVQLNAVIRVINEEE